MASRFVSLVARAHLHVSAPRLRIAHRGQQLLCTACRPAILAVLHAGCAVNRRIAAQCDGITRSRAGGVTTSRGKSSSAWTIIVE